MQTSSLFALNLLHDLNHIKKWQGRDRQRKESLERDCERDKRVKHGADGEIRRKVNPDTALPLMTGVKRWNCTVGCSSGCREQGWVLTNRLDVYTVLRCFQTCTRIISWNYPGATCGNDRVSCYGHSSCVKGKLWRKSPLCGHFQEFMSENSSSHSLALSSLSPPTSSALVFKCVVFWLAGALQQTIYAYMIVCSRSSGMGESQQVVAEQISWKKREED